MMLVELTRVPLAAIPVATFKDHLRLGSGFSDDDVQDTLLEAHLRAAMAAIEARTGRILITRDFSWTLSRWRDATRQALPVSPVQAVTAVVLLDSAGGETTIDPVRWVLQQDSQRPALCPVSGLLPSLPAGGAVRIDLTAGYGAAWADLPDDLAQAVVMLAAHFYENRFALADAPAAMPATVQALIAGYRNLRLFMGGGYA